MKKHHLSHTKNSLRFEILEERDVISSSILGLVGAALFAAPIDNTTPSSSESVPVAFQTMRESETALSFHEAMSLHYEQRRMISVFPLQNENGFQEFSLGERQQAFHSDSNEASSGADVSFFISLGNGNLLASPIMINDPMELKLLQELYYFSSDIHHANNNITVTPVSISVSTIAPISPLSNTAAQPISLSINSLGGGTTTSSPEVAQSPTTHTQSFKPVYNDMTPTLDEEAVIMADDSQEFRFSEITQDQYEERMQDEIFRGESMESMTPMYSSQACGGGCGSSGSAAPYLNEYEHIPTGVQNCTYRAGLGEVFFDSQDTNKTRVISIWAYFNDDNTPSYDMQFSVTTGNTSVVTPSITPRIYQGKTFSELTLVFTDMSGTSNIVVTATDRDGNTCDLPINIYSVQVTGFTVQERAWGEGTGTSGWHAVEDKGNDWGLLWTENEYAWTPTVINIGTGVVARTSWHAVPWSQRATATATSQNKFAASQYYETPTHDMTAYGTPGVGEYAIIPTVGIMFESYCTLMTSMNELAAYNWAKSPNASAQHPRIGVTGIASVDWVPVEWYEGVAHTTTNGNLFPGENKATLSRVTATECAIFPEQRFPTDDVQNRVKALVWLASPIPQGMTADIWFQQIDPDNKLGFGGDNNDEQAPDGSTIPIPNDNYGASKITAYTKILGGCNYGTSEMTIVSAFAGDNYRMAVHPNKDVFSIINDDGTFVKKYHFANDGITIVIAHNGSNKTFTQSSILTVWRTLWVELDAMLAPSTATELAAHGFLPNQQYPSGSPSTWGYVQPPNEASSYKDYDMIFNIPKPDITMLRSAMAAACIRVEEIPQDAALNYWRVGDTNGKWDVHTPFVRNLVANNNITVSNTGRPSRDVNYSDPTFWCIQGVGAYEELPEHDHDPSTDDPCFGLAAAQYSGVFLIFQETIRDWVSTGNGNKRTISEMNQLSTFHEVLHLFGFDDIGDPVVDPFNGKIMTGDFVISESLDGYTTLSPQQIRKIQVQKHPK